MGYHSIEKGMALPNPRPGFGQEVISRLLVDAKRIESEFGGHPSVDVARRVLRQYETDIAEGAFGEDQGFAGFVGNRSSEDEGGTLSVSRKDIHAAAKIDLSDFFRARYSVRNFAPGEVASTTIEEAVGLASKTPSVCNRQSARVHAVLESGLATRVLETQNGNSGFRDTIPAVLAITVDLRKFVSCAERYQGWIDGGLFAMSLCYALHSMGLGTCMLNWSAEVQQDRKLRNVLSIPDCENVIMLMAVGYLPEAFDVAASPRRPVSSLLTVHSVRRQEFTRA
jgi:nitroreductase